MKIEQQKQNLSKFWKKYFNHIIDWDNLMVPQERTGFDVLEYIPDFLTEDDIRNKYAEIFGKESVWKHYNNIRKSIKVQQARPTGNRLVWHKGGQQSDVEHFNKSYDDFYQDGKTYMIPIEGMIAALRYGISTGNMMDVEGLTRFHAIGSGGGAMYAHVYNNSTSHICEGFRDDHNAICGPREVIL